jgi:uncharacterized Zn-binding protein involved in type VI secretion
LPINAGASDTALPGSAADPLITIGWLEEYVQSSFEPLNKRLEELEQKLSSNVKIVLTIGNPTAQVNGKTATIPAPPQIMGAGYTMVPARFIGEALGLGVEWDAAGRKVVFSGQGQNIALTIGNNTASINGKPYAMPIAPLIAGSHTLVHARFISEALHCKVEWNPATRQVTIIK